MRIAILIIVGGCCGTGSPAAPPVAPTKPVADVPVVPVVRSAELTPALEPLAYLLGDWTAEDRRDHWVAASGAIYGVSLHRDGSFAVMIVDDAAGGGKADGVVRLYAIADGASAVELRAATVGVQTATFTSSTSDPKAVAYQRTARGLHVEIDGARPSVVDLAASEAAPAPELEAADLAFAKETGARGAEGWSAAFDPKGGMLRAGARIEGGAIGETMAPLLAAGHLDWAPIASRRDGDLGFTVGKASFAGATAEESWRSSYVTIWRHQPDGTWKVLFDAGRAVND